MRAGEKLIMCGVCENGQVVKMKDEVDLSSCSRCHKATLKAVRVVHTDINGAGRNKTADLGLALLMEMGAGAPDIKENRNFS